MSDQSQWGQGQGPGQDQWGQQQQQPPPQQQQPQQPWGQPAPVDGQPWPQQPPADTQPWPQQAPNDAQAWGQPAPQYGQPQYGPPQYGPAPEFGAQSPQYGQPQYGPPPQFGAAPPQYETQAQYETQPQFQTQQYAAPPQYGAAPQWGQQWQGQQQPGPGYGWPAPPGPAPRRIARKQVIAIVGVVAVAVVAGGVYAFEHFKGSSDAVAAVTCAPSTLSSCLVAKPSSSSAYTDSWRASTAPTKDDYLKWAFDSDPVAQKTAGDNLTSEGLQTIAHTAWKASDGNGIDITLLKFSGVQGAHARGLELLGTDVSTGTAQPVSSTVPGSAYVSSKANSDGDTVTRYSASVGDIALEVHYYSRGSFSGASADFSSWVGAEYQSLTTAPKVSASPQPTSTTQSVTCGSSLSSCLISAPSGSTPWDDDWGGNAAPSAAQYTHQMFGGTKWESITNARLKSLGLTGIHHRTWITSNGTEADDVLLSFSSANSAMSWYKNDSYSTSGTSFSVPGQQNTTGTYDPKADSAGNIVAQVFGVSGTVEMELFTFSPSSFDKTRTVTWASQQLSKIGGTSTTKTVAVPPVPTPSAAPSAGSGSCSSAEDCLIEGPSGSVAWSGTDYDKSTTATVEQYVHENWSSDTADEQTYEENLLNDAGVTAIAHREWDATDGTSAMLTLLQYDSATSAHSEALDYQGAILATGTELTVPGLNNAVVDIKPMDSGGDIPVKIDVWKGKYEVRLAFYSPATADPQAAVSVALQQLAALPGS